MGPGVEISTFAVRESVRAIRGRFVGGMRGEKVWVEKIDIFDPSIGPNVGRNAVFKGLSQIWGWECRWGEGGRCQWQYELAGGRLWPPGSSGSGGCPSNEVLRPPGRKNVSNLGGRLGSKIS